MVSPLIDLDTCNWPLNRSAANSRCTKTVPATGDKWWHLSCNGREYTAHSSALDYTGSILFCNNLGLDLFHWESVEQFEDAQWMSSTYIELSVETLKRVQHLRPFCNFRCLLDRILDISEVKDGRRLQRQQLQCSLGNYTGPCISVMG